MLIRQTTAARLLGVNPITLYRWQKRGIVKPARTSRPGRWYHEEDIAALCVDVSHLSEADTSTDRHPTVG